MDLAAPNGFLSWASAQVSSRMGNMWKVISFLHVKRISNKSSVHGDGAAKCLCSFSWEFGVDWFHVNTHLCSSDICVTRCSGYFHVTTYPHALWLCCIVRCIRSAILCGVSDTAVCCAVLCSVCCNGEHVDHIEWCYVMLSFVALCCIMLCCVALHRIVAC